MAGLVTTEGETLIAEVIHQRIHIDRGVDLELGLFTNVGADDTLTEATVTEPSGTGYARIALTDATWGITGSVADYAQQTFTGGAGGWTGDIYGYFISTNGTTSRLLYLEIDPGGSYTINENDTYKITPNVTISG